VFSGLIFVGLFYGYWLELRSDAVPMYARPTNHSRRKGSTVNDWLTLLIALRSRACELSCSAR
jgi:hypothetical protein